MEGGGGSSGELPRRANIRTTRCPSFVPAASRSAPRWTSAGMHTFSQSPSPPTSAEGNKGGTPGAPPPFGELEEGAGGAERGGGEARARLRGGGETAGGGEAASSSAPSRAAAAFAAAASAAFTSEVSAAGLDGSVPTRGLDALLLALPLAGGAPAEGVAGEAAPSGAATSARGLAFFFDGGGGDGVGGGDAGGEAGGGDARGGDARGGDARGGDALGGDTCGEAAGGDAAGGDAAGGDAAGGEALCGGAAAGGESARTNVAFDLSPISGSSVAFIFRMDLGLPSFEVSPLAGPYF